MKRTKLTLTKDAKTCLAALGMILFAYGGERILMLLTAPTKTLAIVLAMVNTLLLLIVTLILMKSNEFFYGMLTALIGYKMMPAPLLMLEAFSVDATVLYYIVKKAAVLIFMFLIFRFYSKQEGEHKVKALPILAMMLAVPFFTEIGGVLTNYFLAKTGSMLLGYFSQFAVYIAATAFILAIGYVCGYESLRFAAYFEIAALGINFIRVGAKAVVKLYNHQHVSKSLFVWLAIYVVLMAVALFLKKYKEKQTA